MTYFRNEDLILWATENLINSTFGWFYGERGEYIINIVMQFFCALGRRFGGKNYLKSCVRNRIRVAAKFGVFSSYGCREILSGHDGQKDGRT